MLPPDGVIHRAGIMEIGRPTAFEQWVAMVRENSSPQNLRNSGPLFLAFCMHNGRMCVLTAPSLHAVPNLHGRRGGHEVRSFRC